ncbi:hypothetical protein BV25DRAFT_1832756 [Artomyces pyxidatus]|uniref:Uncharacterized protein n=1 Tax=Artomyces pyxidatus TaxID=48021 RepID=A0ACB8SI86_9AGAM|nr:hypothetical protein BV25DRAFT_1832756 [Artomyces pyxidatus]
MVENKSALALSARASYPRHPVQLRSKATSMPSQSEDVPFMAIFASEMAPYKPPSHPIARCIWRWRLRFECLFALTVLEPWEKGLYLTIMGLFLTLVLTWVWNFLPRYMTFVLHRGMFYLMGTDVGESASLQEVGAKGLMIGLNATSALSNTGF